MARSIYRGQKSKFAANISGIGNLSPNDSTVDFTLIFYIPGKEGQVEVKKEDCTFEGSTAMFLLDVSSLPDGRISAFAKITYEEEGFSEPITDMVDIKFDTLYEVYDAPVSIAEAAAALAEE